MNNLINSCIENTSFGDFCRHIAETLIGGAGRGVYSFTHVLSDELLFKSNSNSSIWEEI